MTFQTEVDATAKWFGSSRFAETTRLYSPRQVVEQRGSIATEYVVARDAAAAFFQLMRELFSKGKSITTFGPYSTGQAVMMKRLGIPGIYLGGWATSAKGSVTEDRGADLASYPLSQVPDEAAVLVRALLAADRNQQFARSRMTDEERASAVEYDYRPFIIADADTGHGGDAHVRNLIRRFVEVGVTGYHIEDQKPGAKKCGHQGGKVLVPVDEQIKRLNAARFQLDVMEVAGIIVSRTDAESAALLDGNADERDQPFILGATNLSIPSYKSCLLAVLKRIHDAGISDVNGHLLYRQPEQDLVRAADWFSEVGFNDELDRMIGELKDAPTARFEAVMNEVSNALVAAWEKDAGIKTFAEAVVGAINQRTAEGTEFEVTVEQWLEFAKGASHAEAREKAKAWGINTAWDCELARTPEGYYQVRGGIDYAIAKSLAVSPYCDILWMETKTADLEDAKVFADAIHARFPDKMLAYNLSPSFSWDTTGMSEDEMRAFPTELGKLGFVFNFITYGGHQIDGLAAEEFSVALQEDGMLALARLQRKFRLTESPYKTPQTFVGGPRLDGALTASSGRTATTKAMGKGSTQFQHLVETEVPAKVLESWLALWAGEHDIASSMKVRLRPHSAGSELLELSVVDEFDNKIANVVFASIQDRRGRRILSIRDQTTQRESYRKKRFMTLMQLFMIKRFKSDSIHYVSPTEDNQHQTKGMQRSGIFSEVTTEVGDIIVATVDRKTVAELTGTDEIEVGRLIRRER